MRAAGTGTDRQRLLGPRTRPAPYMASYAATKHAIEGYSESVDHEVEIARHPSAPHRACLGRRGRASTRTPSSPTLPSDLRQESAHLRWRDRARHGDGDDPSMVANAIVAAATDRKPKLRLHPGSLSGRVTPRAPLRSQPVFDRQIRKAQPLARLKEGTTNVATTRPSRRSPSSHRSCCGCADPGRRPAGPRQDGLAAAVWRVGLLGVEAQPLLGRLNRRLRARPRPRRRR